MARLFLSLIAFFLLCGISYAADSATVPPAKIGVVDMQTVATDSDPAKAAKAQMEAKYGKEGAAIEKRAKDLEKQAAALKNPKSKEKAREDFLAALNKLNKDKQNFQRKVQQDEIKLRQEMVTLVFSATYEVARAKGFNFVVDVTAGGVLYADQSMDLTQDVLAEVNKIYAANKNKTSQDTPAPAKDSPK